MRVASIGSGSQGNGTLIHNGESGSILVDCGFSAKETRSRMAAKEFNPADLVGILVTHEHTDHVKGVATTANALRVPVYCTWGTYQASLVGRLDEALFHCIEPNGYFSCAELSVQAVAVPHDASDPCQYVLTHSSGSRLGILSDIGSFTRVQILAYQGCHALMLECNHDLRMLAEGPYPAQLKRRVAGHYGHLSNAQAADFLRQVVHPDLGHLIATHVSQKNNTQELALGALAPVIAGSAVRVRAATQSCGFDWIEIQPRNLMMQTPDRERQLVLDLDI